MTSDMTQGMTVWRRAQPWLGTLVEIGVPQGSAHEGLVNQAIQDAFAVVAQVHRCMSRFEPDSDVSRFHQAAVGEAVRINGHTARVLALAEELHDLTEGVFDVALGTGRWRLDQAHWFKLDETTQVDLGGIAKGYAVDVAMTALQDRQIPVAWVNAGGDLRVMGTDLPVELRDEQTGGVRPWARIRDAALATSYFGVGAGSQLHGQAQALHVTVAADRCAVADALTKVVARVGLEKAEPWLGFFQAQAWVHA